MPDVFAPAIALPLLPAPRAAWFIGGGEGLVAAEEAGRVRLPSEAEAAAMGATRADALYLGRLGDELDCFAHGLAGDAPLPLPLARRSLRGLFGALDESLFPIAGRAVQLITWDQTHRFCGRCGGATVRATRERNRSCPGCALAAYPRISPAVIVLVERGDEILLARAANFPNAN